jgi:hypothetical protein
MSRKKLIIVGLDVFFADSFLWFRENGWEVTVLAHRGPAPWFAENAGLYEDMGFRVVRYDRGAFEENGFRFDDLALDPETLILAGPNFEGDLAALADDLKGSTLYDLWLLQALAGYNRRRARGALVVRFHNGDTGFGSREMADLYALALREVDLLLFDNDLLREFVLGNAPSLKAKESRLVWLEGPLKRHIRRNEGRGPNFICLGRFVCGRRLNLPVLHFPMDRARHFEGLPGPVRPRYALSGAPSLSRLAEERAAFAADLRGTVFGLDHLGGLLEGDRELFERHKKFFFSLDGQHLARSGEPREIYWHFCNCPSKIAAYLMYGLIPVLPHTLHSVYRDLADRKMAVAVERPEDLARLPQMSDEEIKAFRDNIQAQADLFTFDRKAAFLAGEFEKFQAGADGRPKRPPLGARDEDQAFGRLIRQCLERGRRKQAGPAAARPADQRTEPFLGVPEVPAVRPRPDKWWLRALRAVSPHLVDAGLIAASGLFDARYYFLNNPGLLKKRRNPVWGYVRKGAREGRNPNAWFDTKQYLREHPEAARSGLNPLVHYLYVHYGAVKK